MKVLQLSELNRSISESLTRAESNERVKRILEERVQFHVEKFTQTQDEIKSLVLQFIEGDVCSDTFLVCMELLLENIRLSNQAIETLDKETKGDK